MTKQEGQKVFNTITGVFEKNKISVWPDFGTLLGIVRGGGLIEWDGDIDFGMKAEEYSPWLQVYLEKAGFRVRRAPAWEKEWMFDYVRIAAKGKTIKLSMSYGDTRVGLHIWRRGWGGAKGWRFFTHYDDKLIRAPEEFFDQLISREFLGQKICVPARSEEYLEWLYGPGWTTPNPRYMGSEEHIKNRERWTVCPPRHKTHDLTAFFPGKFHPPHAGHIETIRREAKRFKKFIVGVAGKIPENPIMTQKEIVEQMKSIAGNNIEVVKFEGSLLDRPNARKIASFDVIVSGNPDILRWARRAGHCYFATPRSGEWSGTEIRKKIINKHENS